VDGDPTDEAIEAILAAVPDDRWAELWAAMEGLRTGETHATWEVGDPDQPVRQMPYVVYSDAARRLVSSLGAVGGVVPFAWPKWDGVQRYEGGRGLDDAPVADAVRLITAVIRADRFGEGTIAAALEDGTLAAAVRRLRRWFDEERRPGSPPA
jgi:hypothetical protein